MVRFDNAVWLLVAVLLLAFAESCLPLVKMKNLKVVKYQTKRGDTRWGISMHYPALFNVFDSHLASLPTEQVIKAGFSLEAKDLEERGCPAEQAIAMQLNTYLTGKINAERMSDFTEAEILEYSSKNFIHTAVEAKSTADKISAAVETASSWFVEKAIEMGGLFVAGKDAEALAIQAEIEARKLNPPTS